MTDRRMRQWHRSIERESEEARARFGSRMEDLPADAEVWLSVLVEEVGKLARCTNKLGLASDAAVRDAWERETDYRLITIASIAARWAVHRRGERNPKCHR